MADRHWSDDEMIARLYEVGPEGLHLQECESCAQRWQRLAAARAQILRAPAVSEGFLAAQRRAIYGRLDRTPERSPGWRLAPGLALAFMLLLAVLLVRPAPEPETSLASSDAQFFTEVYSVVQSTEPRAAGPLHGLFEVQQ